MSVNRAAKNPVLNEKFAEIIEIIKNDKSKLKDEDILEFYGKTTGTFTKKFHKDIISNYKSNAKYYKN